MDAVGLSPVRAKLLAGLVRVAGVAAAVRRPPPSSRFAVAGVARIVDQRPGAIERRRAEIVVDSSAPYRRPHSRRRN